MKFKHKCSVHILMLALERMLLLLMRFIQAHWNRPEVFFSLFISSRSYRNTIYLVLFYNLINVFGFFFLLLGFEELCDAHLRNKINKIATRLSGRDARKKERKKKLRNNKFISIPCISVYWSLDFFFCICNWYIVCHHLQSVYDIHVKKIAIIHNTCMYTTSDRATRKRKNNLF